MKFSKNIILAALALAIAGSIWYLEKDKVSPAAGPKEDTTIPFSPELFAEKPASNTNTDSGREIAGDEPGFQENQNFRSPTEKNIKFPRAKEISLPSGFINTPAGFKIADLIGKKVILVDFWTYSCINCQRTTPYLNAWYDKYKDKGLEIVGVHTPEFDFEKKYDNVVSAVEKLGIKYPVVMDNDYGTWTAYGNSYWPRKYLIDIDGFIVYDHIGEGAYEETEKKIQEALEERMYRLNEQGRVSSELVSPSGTEATDSKKVYSPEIYFGAFRNQLFGNGIKNQTGEQDLSAPEEDIISNILYLSGKWNFAREYAENKETGAKIIFRYTGNKLYFVASADEEVLIKIKRDGQPVSDVAGEDVKKDGTGEAAIKDERLYKIIDDSNYGEHTLEIIIENPGLKAFTFTFG